MSHIQSKQEIRDISFGMIQEQLEEEGVNFPSKRFGHDRGNIVAFNQMSHEALVTAVDDIGMFAEFRGELSHETNKTDFIETFRVISGYHKMTIHGFLDMRGTRDSIVIEGVELLFSEFDDYVGELATMMHRANDFSLTKNEFRAWFD